MLPNKRKHYGKGTSARSESEIGQNGVKRKRKMPWYKKLLSLMIPTKKDSKIDKMRKVIFDVAVLVFIGSCTYLITYYSQSGNNASFYNGIADLLGKGEVSENYPRSYLTKFASLWEINDDITGWLTIDGTKVNYPVVQTNDNEYYLRRDFSKADNKYGIPFLDCRANIEDPSTNLLIYGHNMKDGQMFGELINFQNLEYYKKHPIIKFDSLYEEGQYKIVGMFIASTLPEHAPNFEYHNFISGTDEELMNYASEILSRSLIVTGVDIQPGDHLITLSTCTYDFKEARFAIVARRVREGENATVDTSKAYINPEPVMPKAWYEAKEIAKLVAGVTMNPTEVTLNPGQTATLQATVTPSTAVNRKVTWSSSDSSIATVDANGVVTAHKKGTATITVRTEESGFTASAKVTVNGSAISEISFLAENVSVAVGAKANLRDILQVTPADAALDGLVWATDKPDIATITPEGVLSGLKAGETWVTVTTPGGPTAQILVKVGTYVPIEYLTITGNATVQVGKTSQLAAIINPENATYRTVVWESSNTKIATVDANGLVKAKKTGTAVITAYVIDNGVRKEAKATITVVDQVQGITGLRFTANQATLAVGNSDSLLRILEIQPAGVSTDTLIWSCSDSSKASVDENGVIKGLKNGTVVVYVQTEDGVHTAQIEIEITGGSGGGDGGSSSSSSTPTDPEPPVDPESPTDPADSKASTPGGIPIG